MLRALGGKRQAHEGGRSNSKAGKGLGKYDSDKAWKKVAPQKGNLWSKQWKAIGDLVGKETGIRFSTTADQAWLQGVLENLGQNAEDLSTKFQNARAEIEAKVKDSDLKVLLLAIIGRGERAAGIQQVSAPQQGTGGATQTWSHFDTESAWASGSSAGKSEWKTNWSSLQYLIAQEPDSNFKGGFLLKEAIRQEMKTSENAGNPADKNMALTKLESRVKEKISDSDLKRTLLSIITHARKSIGVVSGESIHGAHPMDLPAGMEIHTTSVVAQLFGNLPQNDDGHYQIQTPKQLMDLAGGLSGLELNAADEATLAENLAKLEVPQNQGGETGQIHQMLLVLQQDPALPPMFTQWLLKGSSSKASVDARRLTRGLSTQKSKMDLPKIIMDGLNDEELSNHLNDLEEAQKLVGQLLGYAGNRKYKAQALEKLDQLADLAAAPNVSDDIRAKLVEQMVHHADDLTTDGDQFQLQAIVAKLDVNQAIGMRQEVFLVKLAAARPEALDEAIRTLQSQLKQADDSQDSAIQSQLERLQARKEKAKLYESDPEVRQMQTDFKDHSPDAILAETLKDMALSPDDQAAKRDEIGETMANMLKDIQLGKKNAVGQFRSKFGKNHFDGSAVGDLMVAAQTLRMVQQKLSLTGDQVKQSELDTFDTAPDSILDLSTMIRDQVLAKQMTFIKELGFGSSQDIRDAMGKLPDKGAVRKYIALHRSDPMFVANFKAVINAIRDEKREKDPSASVEELRYLYHVLSSDEDAAESLSSELSEAMTAMIQVHLLGDEDLGLAPVSVGAEFRKKDDFSLIVTEMYESRYKDQVMELLRPMVVQIAKIVQGAGGSQKFRPTDRENKARFEGLVRTMVGGLSAVCQQMPGELKAAMTLLSNQVGQHRKGAIKASNAIGLLRVIAPALSPGFQSQYPDLNSPLLFLSKLLMSMGNEATIGSKEKWQAPYAEVAADQMPALKSTLNMMVPGEWSD